MEYPKLLFFGGNHNIIFNQIFGRVSILNTILKKESDFNVIAAFGDSKFVIDKISELIPNVVIIDLGLSNQNSLELV